MQINEETIKKIAKLSRIKVADEDVPKYADELTKILDWVEQLDELDVSDVAPMASVVHDELPMREDKITDGGKTKQVLSNAPESEFDCFIVPKVVDQG